MKNFSFPLLFLCSFAFSLSNQCPPGFTQKKNLCYYASPYLDGKSTHGLVKGITSYQGGMNPKEIDLGRLLFFDPILSKDKTLSCAHCHTPQAGLSDGRKRSFGRNRKELARSAPTLWNVAFLEKFFWDGRANNLEEQLSGPLFSTDEMANTPEHLERDLNQSPAYKKLFFEVFGTRKISYPLVAQALTTFERSLISLNSRYDKFVLGDTEALNKDEIAGHNLFRSFVTRCTECHTPPLFTNSQLVNLGLPEDPKGPKDLGLEQVTRDPKHRDHFKVPTLRNIAQSAPYMHSGIFQTLEEVVHFYNSGGGRDGDGKFSPYIHWHIRKIGMSSEEERLIVTFLKTLTDESSAPEIPIQVPSGLKISQGEKK